MPQVEITTIYLEMATADRLTPSADSGLNILEATVPCPELNRFLYAAVGGQYYWLGRLTWSYQQWLDYLSQDSVRTWVGYVGGNPVGYFELSRENREVEIAYFGLLPQFYGQGHGGYLLSKAIRNACVWQAKRVWVHTNNLDGPYALRNYQARGLTIYDETREFYDLPSTPVGPWPGWQST